MDLPPRFRRLIATAAFAGALGVCTPIFAQPADPALAREMDAAFARMIADPADLDLTFAYAAAAARAGNYEGAIASLERMLLADPGLPRVRFELGTLYYRIESWEAARGYFRSAREVGGLPPELGARTAEFLAEIDRRQSPHRFAGSITVGGRFQTNANSNNNEAFVRIPALGGLNVTDSGSNRKQDWNLFATAGLTHNYEWAPGSGDSWESEFSVYGTRHNRVKSVETAIAEMTTGPRFAMPPGLFDAASIRPYALANLVSLADTRYYHTGGGGAQFQGVFARDFQWMLGYELRQTNFRPDATRSTARDEQGMSRTVSTSLVWNATPDDTFTIGIGYGRLQARTAYKSYKQVESSLGYARRVPAPFGLGAGPWTFGFVGTREITSYRAGDPNVDRRARRGDREWRYALSLNVPVTDDIAVIFVGQRQTVWSSYDVNNYRNDSATAGLTWNF